MWCLRGIGYLLNTQEAAILYTWEFTFDTELVRYKECVMKKKGPKKGGCGR